MGKRGPQPTPTEEKKRLGNPGRRPLNNAEPKSKGMPAPPDYLDQYAKKVWRRVLLSMAQGVYTACDTELLAAYCVASSLHRRAIRINNKKLKTMPEGTTAKDWIRIQKEQAMLLASIGTRLGLDPSARAAIKIPDDKPAGKFGKFKTINGGK